MKEFYLSKQIVSTVSYEAVFLSMYKKISYRVSFKDRIRFCLCSFPEYDTLIKDEQGNCFTITLFKLT